MNNDLISREALRKDIEHLHNVYVENKEWFYTDVLDHIDNAPTVERPHGEWLGLCDTPNAKYKWSCNKCGRGVKEQENFCPACGANMRKGGNK